MASTLYSHQEKDLLYSLIYNYLKYGRYEKAIILIHNLSFHWSNVYLLQCLLYSQIMLQNYSQAWVVVDRLRALDRNVNQDGWFMLMQSILVMREKRAKHK